MKFVKIENILGNIEYVNIENINTVEKYVDEEKYAIHMCGGYRVLISSNEFEMYIKPNITK